MRSYGKVNEVLLKLGGREGGREGGRASPHIHYMYFATPDPLTELNTADSCYSKIT